MFTSKDLHSTESRVLVVDDIADNRELLQTILEGEGYIVETAAEGYTAIAKIEQCPPDLVLLDLMMPDLDGYEVTRWLAQNHPSVPVLIVTGYNDLPEQCWSLGFVVDWIRKPIALDELLEKTQAFVVAARNRQIQDGDASH